MKETFKDWFASQQLRHKHSHWAKEDESVIHPYQKKPSPFFSIYCLVMFFVFIPFVVIGLWLFSYLALVIARLVWPLLITYAHFPVNSGSWLTFIMFLVGCFLIWKQTLKLSLKLSVHSYFVLVRYFTQKLKTEY